MTSGPGRRAGSRAGSAGPVIARATRRLEALPLRLRLVALLVVLLLAALTLSGLAASVLMRRNLMSRTDSDLRAAVRPVAEAAINSFEQRPPTVNTFVPPNSYFVRIMFSNGSKPYDASTPTTEKSTPDIPKLTLNDPRVRNHEPFTVGSTDSDQDWRVIAGSIQPGNATFAVAVSLRGVDSTLAQLHLVLILIGTAVTGACVVLGWFGIRRAFRPLAQIEDTAAAIAAGDLGRRIPERTAKDEVTSLSRSLNAMLAQIEHSFAAREASEDRMRQFVADASHELRTPLAAVRGYAELFRQGAVSKPEDIATAMRRIEDESTRMGGLVEDLLLLTRLDDRRPLQLGRVDLTVLAGDAVQDARVLDPTREVRLIGLDGALEPTTVHGDEARLRQVVTNLVANAVNHTPAGTPIEIAVGRPDTGRAQLEVRDHGLGVDPQQARKVFERFYRADPSRMRGRGGGNGLGLAIVAAIVGAHRGEVAVTRTPGGGATFVVDLPATDPSAAEADRGRRVVGEGRRATGGDRRAVVEDRRAVGEGQLAAGEGQQATGEGRRAPSRQA